MPWMTRKPSSIKHLMEMLFDLVDVSPYLCRGQPCDSWALATSLDRLFPLTPKTGTVSEPRHLEASIYSTFWDHADSLLSASERAASETVLGRLSLMQHFGAATRLLDWTESPFVAAYFSAISHPEDDGCIWMFELNAYVEAIQNADSPLEESLAGSHLAGLQATSALANPALHCFFPTAWSPTIVPQRSAFTVCSHLGTPHDQVIGTALPTDWKTVRLSIPSQLKKPLLKMLMLMGIDDFTMFPTLTGLGRCMNSWAKAGHRLRISQEFI